jgi:hypothetical protein
MQNYPNYNESLERYQKEIEVVYKSAFKEIS